jgi:pyrroloquinoline quinone biosynthesis protein D
VSLSIHARPFVAAGFRLQWEPAQDAHVLLYPEGMVKLNRSAGEILSRCTGERTFEEIVADLERQFQQGSLRNDVAGFLDIAKAKGWVEWNNGDAGDGSDEGDVGSRAPEA